MDYNCYNENFSKYKNAVEQQLTEVSGMMPHRDSDVAKAAEYSLLSGGKRIRGVLVLAVCEMLCGSYEKALNLAAAIEMIHSYTLIHDDLPCMDDDELRRGMPSCHVKYGEATALLAGDSLLTHAFGVVASAEIPAEALLTAVQLLSYSAGLGGVIYGQDLDLKNCDKTITEAMLNEIHRNKTGALISTAVQFGAIAGGSESDEFLTLRDFAFTLGMTFQIIDDILDVVGDENELGKPIGSDEQSGKTTYVTLYGKDRAMKYATLLAEENARELEAVFGDKAGFLLMLQQELLKRKS